MSEPKHVFEFVNASYLQLIGHRDLIGIPLADPNKSDPADVAKDGWDAVMSGKSSIFSGWKTKLQGVLANIIPGSVLAEKHREMAEPGSADA